MTIKKYIGVAKDTRTKKEQKKDWKAKELLASSVPIFRVVGSLLEVKKGVIRNQDGSNSCTVNAIVKALEIQLLNKGYEVEEINRIISATYPYQNRSNRPAGGSNPQEMYEWTRKNGFYREADVPSQNMNDAQIDSYKIAENITKQTNYKLNYSIDFNPTFEEVAQYVEQYGSATLWVYGELSAWLNDIPLAKKGNSISHMVAVVDDITLNGVKYLVIDESWGNHNNTELGQRGQRLLTKEAFNAFRYQAQVPILSKKEEIKEIDYSKYKDLPYLEFGYRNKSVLLLQEMLKETGYLSKEIDTINYDKKGNKYGYYGTITASAVLKWQLDTIKDVSQAQLKAWEGKYFGNASRNAIIKLINK